jgi:hypothetical protein
MLPVQESLPLTGDGLLDRQAVIGAFNRRAHVPDVPDRSRAPDA